MADKDKYKYNFRVPWQETCWSCKVDSLNFQCTDELAPLDHFIGQERALEAIRFGLEVDKPGYNRMPRAIVSFSAVRIGDLSIKDSISSSVKSLRMSMELRSSSLLTP